MLYFCDKFDYCVLFRLTAVEAGSAPLGVARGLIRAITLKQNQWPTEAKRYEHRV